MSSPPTRILHALDAAGFGGLFRVVEMLSSAQVMAGHEVHVALTVPRGSAVFPIDARLRAGGAIVHRIAVGSRGYFNQRTQFAQLARNLRPDVVHTHGYRSDVLDAPVAKGLGIPTVSTVHGFTGGDWKNRFYECLQRRAYRRMDAVVGVSRRLYRDLLTWGIGASALHCIPNRWLPLSAILPRAEARRVLGLKDNTFHLGWVGRLSEEKGPDIFLRALERLGVAPIEATIIGEGNIRNLLTSGYSGNIPLHWAGPLPDAGSLMSAFDLLVLSSRTEGTPIVVFEAMAADVPVVATRVGGIPDMLSHDAAFLVAPEDPDALAEAIARAASLPSRALRARARQQGMGDWRAVEQWVNEYDAVYRSVTRKHGE